MVHPSLNAFFLFCFVFFFSKIEKSEMLLDSSTHCLLPNLASAFIFLFQDDSSAPQKIQEALKSCLKEEEPFNIQNSMSPKLEGGKGDQADLEVNCLQNNLT